MLFIKLIFSIDCFGDKLIPGKKILFLLNSLLALKKLFKLFDTLVLTELFSCKDKDLSDNILGELCCLGGKLNLIVAFSFL